MLNLFHNEYSKIFHKVSSYVMLGIWIFILAAIPIGSKVISSLSGSVTYYGDIANELEYAKSSNDYDSNYIEKLETAQELGLTLEDIWGEDSWQGMALNYAYNYRDAIYYATQGQAAETAAEADTVVPEDSESYTTEELAQMQTWSDEIIDTIRQNDWKGYYKILAETSTEDTKLSDDARQIVNDYYTYLMDENISPEQDITSLTLARDYVSNKPWYDEMLAAKEKGEVYDEESFKSVQQSVLSNEYAMLHHTSDMIYENGDSASDISYQYIYTGDTMNAMQNGMSAFMVIFILLMVVAGTMISNEYSQGTIKFLLINPVKRQKIFWSKYITVITLALAATILSFVAEMLLSGIVYGFGGLSAPLLVVQNDVIVSRSGLLFMLGLYMAKFLQAVIAVTISFSLSALFRNSGIAIALGIIVYAVGPAAAEIASMLSLDFVRYTIFANMNVPNILAGIFSFEGMTTGFCLTVIAVHIFLLLFIARDAFVRKNV